MDRGYAIIGLENPKTAANIGSVLRIAGNFRAASVAVKGKRYEKHPTDVQKTYRHLPLFHDVKDFRDFAPFDCVPVAIELSDDARPLGSYRHPERAFYIFGPEDGSVSRSVREWCRDVVYVPTTFCMNLAVTVGVIMWDRMNKARE